MRFLKNKIAIAEAQKKKKDELETRSEKKEDNTTDNLVTSPLNKKRNTQGNSQISESSLAKKNIVKNYGKAICRFASSELATPYLRELVKKEQVSMSNFIDYVRDLREKIDGLFSFRSLLLKKKDDDLTTIAYKNLFQKISEVFIKYFSVNWIFHGKVLYKQTYLNYRYKVLRRIQNPEFFTSLQNFQTQGLSKK